MACTWNLLYSQIPKEIENAEIIEINKLPPRTSVWASSSTYKAMSSNYDNSEWVKSLNGKWMFY